MRVSGGVAVTVAFGTGLEWAMSITSWRWPGWATQKSTSAFRPSSHVTSSSKSQLITASLKEAYCMISLLDSILWAVAGEKRTCIMASPVTSNDRPEAQPTEGGETYSTCEVRPGVFKFEDDAVKIGMSSASDVDENCSLPCQVTIESYSVGAPFRRTTGCLALW